MSSNHGGGGSSKVGGDLQNRVIATVPSLDSIRKSHTLYGLVDSVNLESSAEMAKENDQ